MSKWQNTNKPGTHLIAQVQTYAKRALVINRVWCQPRSGSWSSFSSIRGFLSLFLVGVSLSVVLKYW